jgi:hypothetical protein
MVSFYQLTFLLLQEIDVKAGTGKSMTMGDMLKSFLTRLEWFDTRFPRIPVNVQVRFSALTLKNFIVYQTNYLL